MNNAARINIALKQLKEEVELEIIQIKIELVHSILDSLKKYSPNPSNFESMFSIGNFAINTFVDIGDKKLRINNKIYTNIDPASTADIAAYYAKLHAYASREIIEKPFESVYIHNAIAYNVLVEYLGWNSVPESVEPGIINYSESIDQPFDQDVWSGAKHQAYKPFTIAFRIAKRKLPLLIQKYNRKAK